MREWTESLMIVEPFWDWNVFKQIFVDHWEGFKQFRPRYDTRYYEGLVDKMLDCGNPDNSIVVKVSISFS
jgi:hypothetical protein